MLKRILGIAVALAVPALLAAQTPIPANERASETARSKLIPAEQASDVAQQKVAEAMARLAPLYREAFVLKHVEGRSYEEIAAVMDLSVASLKMRVHRAREALKSLLEEYA